MLGMLLLLLLLADAAQSGKKAKKRRGSSLRLPPSSAKAGAAAYGLSARGEWVAPAQLPTLGPLAATRVGGKRAGEEAGPALHRRIKRDGHLHLRGLLSGEEAAAFRPYVVSEALAIAAACETDCQTKDDPLDEQCRGCERTAATPSAMPKSFVKARNLHRSSPPTARLVTSPRLAAVAASALGVDAVRLYQDVAFLKEPGDMESSWHQCMLCLSSPHTTPTHHTPHRPQNHPSPSHDTTALTSHTVLLPLQRQFRRAAGHRSLRDHLAVAGPVGCGRRGRRAAVCHRQPQSQGAPLAAQASSAAARGSRQPPD